MDIPGRPPFLPTIAKPFDTGPKQGEPWPVGTSSQESGYIWKDITVVTLSQVWRQTLQVSLHCGQLFDELQFRSWGVSVSVMKELAASMGFSTSSTDAAGAASQLSQDFSSRFSVSVTVEVAGSVQRHYLLQAGACSSLTWAEYQLIDIYLVQMFKSFSLSSNTSTTFEVPRNVFTNSKCEGPEPACCPKVAKTIRERFGAGRSSFYSLRFPDDSATLIVLGDRPQSGEVQLDGAQPGTLFYRYQSRKRFDHKGTG